MELTIPSDETIRDMKIMVRCFQNENCLAIIKFLIKHGASNIAEMTDETGIPYRTLQTNQSYLIQHHMLEYKEGFDELDRKVLWFTKLFEVTLQTMMDHEQTKKQYLNNFTKHNINGTRFKI